MNYHDLSVATEHESAAIVSGATDVFRLAALIRACRLLPDGRWICAARKPDVAEVPSARPGTDEPHGARGTSVAPISGAFAFCVVAPQPCDLVYVLFLTNSGTYS